MDGQGGSETVFSWVAALNATAFAGHSDWRVPMINELKTILAETFPCDLALPCVDPPFDNGTDSFTYTANDGSVDSNAATVTITVDPVNDDPTVATPNPDVTVDEDAADTIIDLSATFADVDIATNGDSLALTVNNTNDGPTASAIGPQFIDEDAALDLDVSGSFGDVDTIHGDTLIFSATLADDSALPSWLSIDAGGVLSGTPLNGDVGVINVKVTATDGEASATSAFQLTINNTNDAPGAIGFD